jgi:hypothetical protein
MARIHWEREIYAWDEASRGPLLDRKGAKLAEGQTVRIGAGKQLWTVRGLYESGMIMLGKQNPGGWYDNREIKPGEHSRLVILRPGATPTAERRAAALAEAQAENEYRG